MTNSEVIPVDFYIWCGFRNNHDLWDPEVKPDLPPAVLKIWIYQRSKEDVTSYQWKWTLWFSEFSICSHSVRFNWIKMCNETSFAYNKIFHHDSIYVSLCYPVNWLLKMFEPLNKYFVDQSMGPTVVLNIWN